MLSHGNLAERELQGTLVTSVSRGNVVAGLLPRSQLGSSAGTWTRFNRKHILCGRSLPCADRARKCLDELCWKIEWKHHFLAKESETLPFRMPYQRTTVFNQLPCPSLRSWLHCLKSAVFSVLQEDRSRCKSSTTHVNTFPMIRWVLRRMRDGGWTLLPNDEEPGFCFIRHSETRDIAISSLVPGSYEESHFLDMWLPGMMKTYGVIAKGIGELHGKRTQSAVLSSQWSEGTTAICQIRLLCKTTKSPGEVTFRCVHSGVSNMWTGLSAWLAHHLRVKIEMKLPHLLRDTKEFVDDLRHLHWQDGMRMIKIDIKEFYMSGIRVSCHTLARSSFVMKLWIFNSWLPKLLIGSAEINMCRQNSCLT